MTQASRQFQVFAKPIGPACNLGCHYCYYLPKQALWGPGEPLRMPDDVLETYIAQHIAACPDPEVRFSWHGGEPCLLGLDYFQKIVALQRKHAPPGRRVANGIQTNGTLLDEAWGRFLAAEGFAVGISLDGPPALHDLHRVTRDGRPTHAQALRGYRLLQRYRVPSEILCVVNADNVRQPLEVYRFFKQLGAQYLTFLPLVEGRGEVSTGSTGVSTDSTGVSTDSTGVSTDSTGVSPRTAPPEAFGAFLCAIFDEWKRQDIGRIKVQIFEEAARTAFGQEHTLCVLSPSCGNVPVVEHNGDFYSCDHFVDAAHHLGNIMDTPLIDLLESPAQRAFGQAKLDGLPGECRSCEVLELCNGGCPKDRFCRTPDGEPGLNYLCAGYKQFFTHCRPFVNAVAAVWCQQQAEPPSAGHKPGRNDPCPCGSGKKYKKCCMNKREAG